LSRSPAAYLRFLADKIHEEECDVLFPTHEQVYLLARFRESLQPHVGIALPSFDALRRMQSKSEFAQLSEEVNLPFPKTRVVRTEAELASVTELPGYVKLPHGTAGYGVKHVESADDLRRAYEQFRKAGAIAEHEELVIQKPAHGIQGVAQSVFQHGRLVATHCSEARYVGIGGGQMLRVSASHPAVIEDLKKLGRHLHWRGALFLDYFYDAENGKVEYIEANPRIGETLSSRICGVNLCDILVQVSLGNHVEPCGPTRPGVWSHNGFLVLLARALQGARRRDLIAECWRLLRGTGSYAGCQNEMTRPAEDWASAIPAIAVTLQLLASPKSADRIVRRTVDNYSLPAAAVGRIDDLPQSVLEGHLRELKPDPTEP